MICCVHCKPNQKEDPLLAGEYGKQFSLGMQYDLPAGADAPSLEPASNQFMAVATLIQARNFGLKS